MSARSQSPAKDKRKAVEMAPTALPAKHTEPTDLKSLDKVVLQHTPLSSVIKGTTGDQVVDLVAWHLMEKFKDGSIPFARKLLGGWEVWLQIELCTALLKQFTDAVGGVNQYAVKRETEVLLANGKGDQQGKGLCDFWITPGPNATAKDDTAYVIELKVAYEYEKDGAIMQQLLGERFQQDMLKLKAGLNATATAEVNGKKLKRLCLGVTHFPEELDQGWGNPDPTLKIWTDKQWAGEAINYLWIKEPKKMSLNGKAQDGIALVWWMPDAGVKIDSKTFDQRSTRSGPIGGGTPSKIARQSRL